MQKDFYELCDESLHSINSVIWIIINVIFLKIETPGVFSTELFYQNTFQFSNDLFFFWFVGSYKTYYCLGTFSLDLGRVLLNNLKQCLCWPWLIEIIRVKRSTMNILLGQSKILVLLSIIVRFNRLMSF